MALSVPSNAGFLAVDTSTTAKTIALPLTAEYVGRVLVIKDRTGQAATNPITLQAKGSDTFENGTTLYLMNQPFGVVTLVSRGGQWLFQQNAQEVRTSSITFVKADGYRGDIQQISTGFIEASTVNLLDSYTNVLNYLTVSAATLLLNGSYITGQGGTAVTQIIAGSNISVTPPGGTGAVTITNTGPTTENIVSTVVGLGSAGYVSSINLADLVSTPNLLDLVSTPNLLDLVSTPNLLDLVSTSFLDEKLVSTVEGLGQIYLSTATTPPYLSTLSISTGSLITSSGTFVDVLNPGAYDAYILNSNSELHYQANEHIFTDSNNGFSATRAFAYTLYQGTLGDTPLSVYGLVAKDAYTGTISTPTFIDGNTNAVTSLYLSSLFLGNTGGTLVGELTTDDTVTNIYWKGSQLNNQGGGGITSNDLISTVEGLGTAGYLSTVNLQDLISTPNLLDLVSTPNLLDLVSTPNLIDLVSTPNLLDLVSTPNLLDLISTPNLLDLISTPNLLDLISTPNLLDLVSTPNLLDLISTPNLLDLVSTPNLLDLISTPNLLDLVSSPNLVDLVSTPNLLDLVSSPNLLDLVSTPNLLDLVSTPNLLDLVSTTFLDTSLISTVVGLGQIYISTASGSITEANLVSTVEGLGTIGYISSIAGLISTPNILDLISTPNLLDLVSTPNLLDLISTPNLLDLISTPNLLDLVSTPNLLDLISTPNLLDLISTPNLLDVVSTPNLLDLVSTPNLLDLISTPNLLDLVSTPNLLDLVSTSFLDTSLLSTVDGLGQLYLSTVPLYVSTLWISAGSVELSTLVLVDQIDPSIYAAGAIFQKGGNLFVQDKRTLFVQSDSNLTNIGVNYVTIAEGNPDDAPHFSYFVIGGFKFTGDISTLAIGDGQTSGVGSLYISSLFLGNKGGTVVGEITTDDTATNLYWKGSQLNNQTGGGGSAAVPYLSSFTLSTTEVLTSSIGGTAGVLYITGNTIDLRGATLDDSLTSTITFGNTSRRIDVGSNLISSSAGYIGFTNIAVMGSTTSLAVFVGNPSPTSIAVQDFYQNNIYVDVNSNIFDSNALCVVSAYDKYIAGGNLDSAGNTFAISYDGYIWQGIGSNKLDTRVNGLAHNLFNGLTVAVGAHSIPGSTLTYSYDGLDWVSPNVSPPFTEGRCIATNTNLWVMGGKGPTDTLAYGLNPNSLVGAGCNVFDNFVAGVAWGYDKWVAVGASLTTGNTIAYSYDGINWIGLGNTIFDVAGLCVAFNGKQWIAGGVGTTNTIASSPDGINWIGDGILFTDSTISVAWNASAFEWYAGGSGGATLFTKSPYAISWTDQTANLPATTQINGIAAGGPSNTQGQLFSLGAIGTRSLFVETITSLQGIVYANYDYSSQLNQFLIDPVARKIGIECNNPQRTLDVNGDGYFTTLSTLMVDSTEGFFRSTISTHSLVVYGPSTFLVQGVSYFQNFVSAPYAVVDTLTMYDQVTQEYGVIRLENGSLVSPAGGNITQFALTSTIGGLGTLGFVSSASLLDLISTPNLLDLISTPNLLDLISTPNLLDLVSSPNLVNLVSTPNLINLVSTTFLNTSLQSTIRGLGTSGYVSSASLLNLVSTPNLIDHVSTTFLNTSLQSTLRGLGTTGYVSSASLLNLISSPNLINLVSTTLLNTSLQSSIKGLGTAGYVSSASLLNLISTPFLNTSLQSTVEGLATVGYVSSASLLNLVSTPNLINHVSTTFLDTTIQSTVRGLGSAGYVSTANLLNLVSTPNLLNLVSTPNLLNHVSTANLINLVSTANLLNFVSTANLLNLVSTPNLINHVSTLNLLNLVSTPNLINLVSTTFLNTSLASTIQGLGTVGYISTTQLTSTTAYYQRIVSTQQMQTSSIDVSFIVFDDITTVGASSNMYMSTNYLIWGGNVIAGARQAQTQTITF